MKAMLLVVTLSPFVDAGDNLAAGERADPGGRERLAIGLPQSSRSRACDKVDVPRRRFSRECSAGGGLSTEPFDAKVAAHLQRGKP